MSEWSYLLETPVVLELHAKAIARYGGDLGPPKPGCIEGALGNAWTTECYCGSPDTAVKGLHFASCVLSYLVTSHCFGDEAAAYFFAAFVVDPAVESNRPTKQPARPPQSEQTSAAFDRRGGSLRSSSRTLPR